MGSVMLGGLRAWRTNSVDMEKGNDGMRYDL